MHLRSYLEWLYWWRVNGLAVLGMYCSRRRLVIFSGFGQEFGWDVFFSYLGFGCTDGV